MKIGAHVSAAVSLEKSFEKALEIGAQATQIFISPPQQWLQTVHDDQEIERYKSACLETKIEPNFIHATYLVNLGTQSLEHLEKSKDWLIYAMKMAEKLGARGVVIHSGSHKGIGFEKVVDHMVASIKKILENSPGEAYLILENSGSAGGSIGTNFKELGEILKKVGDDRLRICLDIQHAFSSGYDFKNALGIKDAFEDFETEIGLEKLAVIHANDSKSEYKSHKDRHENIGDGFIGKEGFENIIKLMKEKGLDQSVPLILEVPGYSGNGPDKENVALLKSLV